MTPRRIIPILQTSVGVSAMGYGVMFTVLDDFRDKYGISETKLGLLVAAGFFMSFLSQILIAPLADHGYARRLVTFGFLIEAVGALGMGFGKSFSVLLVARILMGFGAGMALPAIRRIVILSDRDNMGRNLGRVLSVDVGGFAMGPVLSALTADTLGLAAPFLIVAGLMLTAGLVASTLQIEETAQEDQSKEHLAFDLLKTPALAGAIVIGLALFIMIGTFDAVWSVMMEDIGSSTWMSNLGITLFALPLIILGPIGGKLTHRIGPFVAATGGLLLGSVCMLLYGNLPVAWMLLSVGIVHGIIDGLTVTGTGMAVGLVAPPARLASAQGLLGGLQTLVGGISATVAGFTYETFGRRTTYAITASVMIFLVITGARLAGSSFKIKESDEVTGPHGTL